MYPVNIKMDGRACLVIGGGHVAQRKVCTLLEEKAAVTVIAPEVCSGLEALFREGRISWRRESYEAPMCGGFCMVVTAAGDKEVALSVQKEAERKGFLYNAADFPALGNCHIPARIKKEGLMVTVSTEGRSPAMAKYVKNWLALEIPDAYGQWLDRMGAVSYTHLDVYKRQQYARTHTGQAVGPSFAGVGSFGYPRCFMAEV